MSTLVLLADKFSDKITYPKNKFISHDKFDIRQLSKTIIQSDELKIESRFNNTINCLHRVDRRGVQIVKGGKKHRICFRDKIKGGYSDLVEKVEFNSTKTFNARNTYSERDDKKINASISCCSIF